MNESLLETEELAPLTAFLTSLAIGLLIGVERERVASPKAGLRTFALTALFGTLAAFLGERAEAAWMPAVGLVLVGIAIIAAYRNEPPEADPGTTTIVALLLAYALGAVCWYGEASVAVPLAIGVTALLYFKPELRGILERFERRDLLSILQFATLSFIVLPVLPDRSVGPYSAINPHEIWLMVVLVSGLSLAGYIALRVAGGQYGLALVGVLGGLVSSTATTLVYSRHGRDAAFAGAAASVILIANLAVLVRIAIVSAIVAPAAMTAVLAVLAPALLAGVAATIAFWRRHTARGDTPIPEIENPTELRTALGFGALFALVLFLSAWLSDVAGARGVYIVAIPSGLTDVDAITLSTLRLFTLGTLTSPQVATAIAIALASNMAFKIALVVAVGSRALARQVVLPGVVSAVAGAIGLAVLWAS
jgi:uncharacterized membrane protein (DUF4010 family)